MTARMATCRKHHHTQHNKSHMRHKPTNSPGLTCTRRPAHTNTSVRQCQVQSLLCLCVRVCRMCMPMCVPVLQCVCKPVCVCVYLCVHPIESPTARLSGYAPASVGGSSPLSRRKATAANTASGVTKCGGGGMSHTACTHTHTHTHTHTRTHVGTYNTASGVTKCGAGGSTQGSHTAQTHTHTHTHTHAHM